MPNFVKRLFRGRMRRDRLILQIGMIVIGHFVFIEFLLMVIIVMGELGDLDSAYHPTSNYSKFMTYTDSFDLKITDYF